MDPLGDLIPYLQVTIPFPIEALNASVSLDVGVCYVYVLR